MIHSMAGGELKIDEVCDIAKVKILSDQNVRFFICDQKNIDINDVVLVPYGKLDQLVEAKVLRIDKNVNSKNFPIKFADMKYIYKKCKMD